MKLFPLLYFIFLININLFSQKKEAIIKMINIKVDAITKVQNHKTAQLSQEEFMDHTTDRGADLTGYFEKGKLVKILSWIGLSNYFVADEYFLDNDKLICVHEVENFFEYNDSTGEETNTVERFDGRYWFDKNKKIDELLFGNDPYKTNGTDPEKEFLADVKKYIPLLYKKYKSGKN